MLLIVWISATAATALWPDHYMHLGHFFRQRCGIAVAMGLGILHFCRHFQITLYKHHDEFHTYQQWKVFIAISIVWFAFLWWLMRLSLLSYIYWPSAVPLRWTVCSELLFIFSFRWFVFCLLFVWIHWIILNINPFPLYMLQTPSSSLSLIF